MQSDYMFAKSIPAISAHCRCAWLRPAYRRKTLRQASTEKSTNIRTEMPYTAW